MLQIRFNRIGKKNRAIFRIVLQEHTIAPGGKHVEILGSWDPHQKKGVFSGEKIKGWITRGAQVTDSVWNLLIREKVIEGKKRAVKINLIKSGEAGPQSAELNGVKKPVETKVESEGTLVATEEKKVDTAQASKEEAKVEEIKKEGLEPKKIKEENKKVEEVKEEEPKEEKKAEETK